MGKALRPFTGGQFALELDGSEVGLISGVDGGHFKSEEVKSQTGVSEYLNLVTKFPGKPKYEDISFTVGMANSPDFWDWVRSTLENKPQARNGAIVAIDFKHRTRQRRTFYDALISEIGFPALDAASKSVAQLTIKISPERMKYEEGDGSRPSPSYGQNELPKQKLWLTSNFMFSLDRFKGDPSLRTSKIEPFSIKQNTMASPIGYMLHTRKFAGLVERPSLQVSFPQSQIQPWMDWWEKCVQQGDYLGELTTGSIIYYASDGSTELMRLDLENVGISSIEFDKFEAHKDGIAKAKVSLYVENIHLKKNDGNI